MPGVRAKQRRDLRAAAPSCFLAERIEPRRTEKPMIRADEAGSRSNSFVVRVIACPQKSYRRARDLARALHLSHA